ncbi:MAG: VOC family protein, partial [Bacteroidota bacterium]
MAQYVSRITLLVTDQDEALKYYTEILGFRLV